MYSGSNILDYDGIFRNSMRVGRALSHSALINSSNPKGTLTYESIISRK
jgi:hypothetical protein